MKWLVLGVILGLLCLVQARDDADGRLVGAISTKTAIQFTTSTTTTPFTCVFTINDAVCQRRRFKRFSDIINMKQIEEEPQVDGSFLEASDGYAAPGPERDGRIALTVWTTTTSTYTFTSTSINTSVTFSLSYFCTVAGGPLPPNCG
ncbi:uncharacterized protein LOC127009190 [Eriocheir sinensis]|uniref:uncharacterized protein LOC127009190 n=1 Tax=Eriocheir sinensis TaxID=95602 RepID=UPI0021C88D05|nr:uncharacterized protein LOC127009190 [Eriocheir sinensis]